MQALVRGFRTHRRTGEQPAGSAHARLVHGSKSSPRTPEEDGEEDEGRRPLSEGLEEDAPLTPCAFQIARFMRFSNRRPQFGVKLKFRNENGAVEAGISWNLENSRWLSFGASVDFHVALPEFFLAAVFVIVVIIFISARKRRWGSKKLTTFQAPGSHRWERGVPAE